MNLVARVACRTIGAAGIGVALYDSAKIAKYFSETGSEHAQEHYLEKAYLTQEQLINSVIHQML